MAESESSILNQVKKVIGFDEDYVAFDADLIIFINSAISTLTQLGVGPTEGFQIEGSNEQWSEFVGEDVMYNMVRTYIYLRVRLLFDPPQTSYAIESLKKQVDEIEWRLEIYANLPQKEEIQNGT